jgi:hypothetical protein
MATYWNRRDELSARVLPRLSIFAEGREIAAVDGPRLDESGEVWVAGAIDWSTLTYEFSDTLTTHVALGGPTYNE